MAWVYVDQQFFFKSGVVWLKKTTSNTNLIQLLITLTYGVLLLKFMVCC